MGTDFKGLIEPKEVSFEELENKILVVDSFNVLYQFLSSIRQADGTLLSDSHGNVTSHLVGLFSRTVRLMSYRIKPVFVFDGKAPRLKSKERERRKEIKQEARAKLEIARQEKDIAAMRKYAARTSKLSDEMVEEAKKLIELLGCPVVLALSEGEAQAAHFVRKGDGFAVVSQDYDSLLYGAPLVVRNLTLSSRKKQRDRLSYEAINPELVSLEDTLKTLKLSQEQLIALAMLIGTDFNVGGIKGIGPKKGYKLVQKHGDDFDALFRDVKWDDCFENSWQEVFKLIKNMPIHDNYRLSWRLPEHSAIIKLLSEDHDFSESRV
ncbi:flap endonuclease-1, partial [Candidatus Woesearchaeota archaeon]|nr:flap endonuclease-1 [Candidatus Woesearchaeota archaeon]